MEGAPGPESSRRRTYFSKLGRKRIYYVVLLLSRLILAVCQAAVALDTWRRFGELSRLPRGGNYDMALDTVPAFKGDLGWVPTARGNAVPPTYGINRLFNLYLIRLSHYFFRRISAFLVWFSSAVFALLLLLCAFDVALMLQRRVREERMKRVAFFVRTGLYTLLFALVFSQFIFLAHYRSSLCSMETLHPFLFFRPGDSTVRLEFLKAGACGLSQRFLSTFVMSFLTLVPDAFLILTAIVPAFRLHSFLNCMKYFGALFFFITAFLVLDLKRYLAVAHDPAVLDWGVERFNEEAVRDGRPEDVIGLLHRQPAFGMVNLKDSISYRVAASLVQGAESGRGANPVFSVPKPIEDRQLRLFHFNFAKQLKAQWRHSSHFYLWFGLYSSVIALVDAVAGTLLIVKRHRFLLPIVGIVNFFYFFTNVLHCIMIQFPIAHAKMSCKLGDFVSDFAGLSFETLAAANLVCKVKHMYLCSFALVICLALISFGTVANLYFLYQYY